MKNLVPGKEYSAMQSAMRNSWWSNNSAIFSRKGENTRIMGSQYSRFRENDFSQCVDFKFSVNTGEDYESGYESKIARQMLIYSCFLHLTGG